MSPDSDIHPHDEIAAYAVDALDDEERRAVEAHLLDCLACRVELDEHLATLSQLDPSPGTGPPPEVWDGIVRQIRDQAGAADDPTQASIRPIPGPRARPRPRRHRNGWLLAAAAAIVLVVGLIVWTRGDSGTQDVGQLAADAVDDPDSTVVTLTDQDGEAVARVVLTDAAADYVLFDRLPVLPSGRSYQLWDTDNPSAPVSLGVLGAGDNGAAQLVLPSETSSLALSEEPASGATAPTGPIVASTA